MNERALRILAPAGVLALGIVLWDLIVRINGIPPYILPSPGLVLATLVADWPILWSSLLATLETTLEGLALAVAGGIGLAVLFNQSRLIEHSLYPYAVILQVTPVVAIAPLLLIYLPQQACGAGLRLDRGVLSGAGQHHARTEFGRSQLGRPVPALRCVALAGARRVEAPAAMPQMLAGIKIAGGLSLIGAVVAEIAAGSAGAGSGLAYRIAESGYRLNIRACSRRCCCCRSPVLRSLRCYRGSHISRCAAGTKARSRAKLRA
jgi:NitT/TauT family transport system permease protein